MPFISLCLVLVLTIIAESLAATTPEDDIFAKFGSDYDLTTETDVVEGFEYTLRNFTFPAFDGGGGRHDRVKRLQQPAIGNNHAPLCIMTFNIRTYTATAQVRSKDVIIAQVSLC